MDDSFATGIIASVQRWSQEQPEPATPDDAAALLTSLHTRLKKLLDAIPHSAQREGLSLLDLQPHLRGRKGGVAHVGELAAALRRLGWQRRRNWGDSQAGFRALWFPPGSN